MVILCFRWGSLYLVSLVEQLFVKQDELLRKVEDLFDSQSFSVFKEGSNVLKAEKDDLELYLYVFSSERFSRDDILNFEFKKDSKIFVDENLHGLESDLEHDVSVISGEQEDESYELPSYELIGDIAVINDLQGKTEDYIVEGIRHYNPNVETILVKEESLSGEFRVGEYDIIYGDSTETIHKEFGCRFKVDPTKTYFSERFSTERKRVVDQIISGEKVLVMFAGVGPFAVLAARKKSVENVVAVEKNPVAFSYLEENIRLNDVEDVVEAYEGDVRDVLPSLEEDFDRVVMPLPGLANRFLDLVLSQDSGLYVHYYRFLEDEDWSSLEREVEEIASDAGFDFKVLDRVKCGEKSPSVDRVCLDLKFEPDQI